MEEHNRSSSAPGAAGGDLEKEIHRPSAPAPPKTRFSLILEEPMEGEPLSYMWIENRPRRPIRFDTNEYLDESA